MRTMRQREPMRRAGCVISMLLVMSADARRSQQNVAPVDSVTGAPAVCSNQTMALIGEVSKVFGPRLFAVAAPGIGAETLVFVPGWRIVTIRTGLCVCILGTIKLTPAIDLIHEWGSFDSD